jgi:hypothetical protein
MVVVVIAVATIANNGRPTQGQGREKEITKKKTERTWNRAVCKFLQTTRGGRRESSGDWKGSMRDRVLNTDMNSYQLRTDDRGEGQGGKKWPDTLTLGGDMNTVSCLVTESCEDVKQNYNCPTRNLRDQNITKYCNAGRRANFLLQK